MAKIRLINMMFYGFHGTYEYEREMGQKFFFDVEAVTGDDPESDEAIKDQVHSTAIYGAVKEVVENNRFHHMRTLAGHIADKLLEQHSTLTEITVKARKSNATISGPIDHIEVEVTRRR
ncbi:MAG: dihydroneopterin aldolase [Anaerovibrio sp.]|nr:dihydroneopterin aldolase [Anaerovibrio sp.]